MGTDNYTSIGELGIIPTAPVMYNPQMLDTESRASMINALSDMNYDMYLEKPLVREWGRIHGCIFFEYWK